VCVCVSHRVHSFLEHWGLINYKVNPDLFPVVAPAINQNPTAMAKEIVDFSRSKPKAKVRRVPAENSDIGGSGAFVLRPNIYAGGAKVLHAHRVYCRLWDHTDVSGTCCIGD
jgi:hypothetical protein